MSAERQLRSYLPVTTTHVHFNYTLWQMVCDYLSTCNKNAPRRVKKLTRNAVNRVGYFPYKLTFRDPNVYYFHAVTKRASRMEALNDIEI